MKRKDVVTLVFIICFSAIISLFLSNLLISSPKNRQQKVEIVEKISAELSQPSTKYFSNNALNPTQVIRIGTDQNEKPFNSLR